MTARFHTHIKIAGINSVVVLERRNMLRVPFATDDAEVTLQEETIWKISPSHTKFKSNGKQAPCNTTVFQPTSVATQDNSDF